MTLRDGHRVGFVAVTGQILMAVHTPPVSVRLHIITIMAAPRLHSRRLGWLPISAHDQPAQARPAKARRAQAPRLAQRTQTGPAGCPRRGGSRGRKTWAHDMTTGLGGGWVSRAMSAADFLIMTAVICVSLGVMLALVFLAGRQSDRDRPPSGQSRGGSVRGGIDIGHARGAVPEDDARAIPGSRQPPDRDREPESGESGGHPRKRREMPAQRRHDH
jgi:hypothetical protein